MVNGNQVSSEGVAEIIVGKQRNGPTGEATVSFVKKFARFENYTNWPEFTSTGDGSSEMGGLPAF